MPSLSALPPANAVSPDADAALPEALAQGLPTLEHAGFTALWHQPGSSTSSSGGGGGGAAALAAAVARDGSSATSLSLGTYARDGATGAVTPVFAPAPGPPPKGRGLMLVGEDVSLGPRRRGRSGGPTSTAFLTVAVDDGRTLLREEPELPLLGPPPPAAAG